MLTVAPQALADGAGSIIAWGNNDTGQCAVPLLDAYLVAVAAAVFPGTSYSLLDGDRPFRDW